MLFRSIITILPGAFNSLLFWKKLKKGITDVVVAETNTLLQHFGYASDIVAHGRLPKYLSMRIKAAL